MIDLEREPMATGILNDLIDFARRNPDCTGHQCYSLEDGRWVQIRIHPPELNMGPRETV